jgi:CheY-like chemotaxis protein
MNGNIGYESKEGEGSFFYIDVPSSVKVQLPVQGDESREPVPISLSGSDKKKILYIEDIPANMELVRQILIHREEIRLLSASTALAGIELAQSESPDVILLDIHMPEMDGLTALQKLQAIEATKNIPVIALTADAMDGDVKRALDMGFKDYMTKPLDVSNFLNVIDKILK